MTLRARPKIGEIPQLGPSIFIVVRWSPSVGRPSGEIRDGIRIVVEEKSPTTFVDKGGGIYEPRPGATKVVTDSPVGHPYTGDDGRLGVNYRVSELHYNLFPDGCYTVTPSIVGSWQSNRLFDGLGVRLIEPQSATVVLKEHNPVQVVEFEIVRKPFFLWRHR